MNNTYANTMAFLATVHFLIEVKGYSKEDAIIEAKKKLEKEQKR